MSAYEPEIEEALKKYSLSSYAVSESGIYAEEMQSLEDLKHAFRDNLADPDEYWDWGTGITTSKHIHAYTRRDFEWGVASAHMKTVPTGRYGAFGFEPGGATCLGFATFYFNEPDNRYEVHMGKYTQGGWISKYLDISSFLPADHQNTKYVYTVDVCKNAVWFSIEGGLVAVMLHGLPQNLPSDFGPDPYWVSGVGFGLPKELPNLVELHEGTEVQTWEIGYRYQVEPGAALPPKCLRLYDFEAGTLMTSGTYDSGTSHKSHPIPVYGYSDKSIYFRADTDSATDGLAVEALTQEGNWRTYETRTLSANSLEVFNLAGEMPLVRIGYEPSADGASITDAEAALA